MTPTPAGNEPIGPNPRRKVPPIGFFRVDNGLGKPACKCEMCGRWIAPDFVRFEVSDMMYLGDRPVLKGGEPFGRKPIWWWGWFYVCRDCISIYLELAEKAGGKARKVTHLRNTKYDPPFDEGD